MGGATFGRMNVHDNILGTIGNTPMVRLNAIAEEFPCSILAKVEYFNPGHSVKDRMALSMIEAAEASGKLKPGGTVIECTSGNTGMGLALACIVKGYKLICTTNCKQSKEKVDVLRAMGAEVHVCPTAVAPDHPESYYSVAEKLHNEIPNSVWCNQYDNLANREAHYRTTGPEIWKQTEGKITHFIVGRVRARTRVTRLSAGIYFFLETFDTNLSKPTRPPTARTNPKRKRTVRSTRQTSIYD